MKNKKKPTVIKSFDQLDKLIGKTLYEKAKTTVTVERPSLLAKQKGRY